MSSISSQWSSTIASNIPNQSAPMLSSPHPSTSHPDVQRDSPALAGHWYVPIRTEEQPDRSFPIEVFTRSTSSKTLERQRKNNHRMLSSGWRFDQMNQSRRFPRESVQSTFEWLKNNNNNRSVIRKSIAFLRAQSRTHRSARRRDSFVTVFNFFFPFDQRRCSCRERRWWLVSLFNETSQSRRTKENLRSVKPRRVESVVW